MEAPRYFNNREIILDVIVFLGIVITTIYTNKKRKKDNDRKGQNYIEKENGTNEEKGVIIKEIQENVKKYKDGKELFTAFYSIPALIICPILLGFCLYGIITNKPDTRSPIYLIIFFILLLVYIFIFKNSKRILDKIKNNFLYKIIMICVILFIIMITAGIGVFVGCAICEKLKLNARLSRIIINIFFVFGIALGSLGLHYFFAMTNKKTLPEKIGNRKPMNKETTNDEIINNKQTYDEIINRHMMK